MEKKKRDKNSFKQRTFDFLFSGLKTNKQTKNNVNMKLKEMDCYDKMFIYYYYIRHIHFY